MHAVHVVVVLWCSARSPSKSNNSRPHVDEHETGWHVVACHRENDGWQLHGGCGVAKVW